MLDVLKQKIYDEMNTPSPLSRRSRILQEMKSLSEKKINCFNCSGTCCTMSANSMQITPLEAFELLLSLDLDLEKEKEKVEELKIRLKENIRHYRLDHELSLGKKGLSHLRKTYTCPFYQEGPKGCTIKKEFKPYGCLGFNPAISNDSGSSCHSNQNLLMTREEDHVGSELPANDFLKETLQIHWNKLEIPKALLILLEKMNEYKK